MAFEPNNVLVTGGAGFIGSHFIRQALRRWPGARFVNLDALTHAGSQTRVADLADDPRYRFVQGDICDAALATDLFAEHGFDTVVHFAAESHVDRSIAGPDIFVRTNVTGTHQLLEAARRAWSRHDMDPARCRFHHISTDEVYGDLAPHDPPFTEDTAFRPSSPYSASKAAAEHLVRAWHRTYAMPVTITNCSNNYGPWQGMESLLPKVIVNALEGQPLPIYGDGQQVRDWLFVTDHCKAIADVIERGAPGESYNVGGDAERANVDIVRSVCDILDELSPEGAPHRRLIEYVADRPGHDRRYAIDSSRLNHRLGWQPETDLQAGLRQTCEWFLDQWRDDGWPAEGRKSL